MSDAMPIASVAGENIPDELIDLRRWVTWRLETRKGKPTKVPYDPYTGHRAASDNPRTWGTFDDAVATYERDDYTGVGFVLGDGFVGVDLDKCRNPETGEIESWAIQIIGDLDSYSEVSPSGTGIHIIVRGNLPEGGRRKGAIEMYDSKRYFTMTGDVVGGRRFVRERQAELEALHARIFGASAASRNGNGQGAPALAERPTVPTALAGSSRLVYNANAEPPFSKFDALCEAEPKFKRSWNHARRDLQDQSASAYDMALANIAVQAGWTDQEIVNLLIAHRRKYFEDLKLRDSYYAVTIRRAREAFGDRTTDHPATNACSVDPPSRDEHLAKISTAFGVRVICVTKYGGDQDGSYELTVTDDAGTERKANLGRAVDVLNPRLTQGAIAGATGAVIPNFKKDERWLNICRAIFAAAGPAPVEQAPEQQEMLSWIRRSLLDSHTDRIDEQDKNGITKLIRDSDPGWAFWNQANQLLIRLDGFMARLDFLRIRASWKDVCQRLRKLGFLPGDLDGREDDQGKARWNVWRSPRDFHRELGVALPDRFSLQKRTQSHAREGGEVGKPHVN